MAHQHYKLNEQIKNTRNDKGQTNFSAHGINEKHIDYYIKAIASKTGTTEADIKAEIQKKFDEFKDLKDKAPLLYSTIYQNFVESEVFQMAQKAKVQVQGAPEFDPALFMELVSFIKVEHKNFFPLRNIIDHKFLKNDQWVLVPSRYDKYKKYNDVETAAATEKGVFIFNAEFCQDLLNWAYIKGIKNKSKKFQGNGGHFPDEYGYIEFLIIHEIMHYTQADWHYQKLFKASGRLSNWVGDFRTNYLLVKSGYPQLPIGLYSDDINYDRQRTMREMYDVVKSEFDKLPKPQQNQMSQAMDGLSDDHDHSQESGDGGEGGGSGEGQESGSGSGKEKSDKEGNGKGSGAGEDEKEGKEKGSGSSDKNLPNEDEMEKASKENNDKLSQNSGNNASADDVEQQKNAGRNAGPTSKGGVGSASKSKLGSNQFGTEVELPVPTYSWNQMLAMLVKEEEGESDESYQKPNKRSIRTLHSVITSGSGSVKPGEIIDYNAMKLMVLLDCSGSMGDVIGDVFSNVQNLIKRHGSSLTNLFITAKFSNDINFYLCDVKNRTAVEISDLKSSLSGKSHSLQYVLSTTEYGATIFSDKMVHKITEAVGLGYNVVIVSDTDILNDHWKLVTTKFKKKVFTIFDSSRSYYEAARVLGTNPKNITYLNNIDE